MNTPDTGCVPLPIAADADELSSSPIILRIWTLSICGGVSVFVTPPDSNFYFGYIVNQPGCYSLKLFSQNQNGEVDSFTYNGIVSGEAPVISNVSINPTVSCNPANVSLSVNITTAFGVIDTFGVDWGCGDYTDTGVVISPISHYYNCPDSCFDITIYTRNSIGCWAWQTINNAVCVLPQPVALFNLYPDTTILHNYFAINMASGSGPLTYLWNWGDGTYDSIPYPNHTYATAGLYTICLSVTDSLGCNNSYCDSFNLLRTTNTMIHINVIPSLVSSVSNLPAATASVSIFPNPVNTLLYIQTENFQPQQIILYDVSGQKMNEQKYASPLDVSILSRGIYFVELKNEEATVRKRFVKM